MHCCLTYEEDEESSLDPRMEDHSPGEDTLAHCIPSIAEEDEDDAEEHFPTASLVDDGWKNQFQRGIYASMKINNMICALTLACTV